MLIPQTFFYSLSDVWKITRNVICQTPHDNLRAEGYGAFILSNDNPNLLLYSEKVNIYTHDKINTGTQKYQYKYDPITSSVSKYFNDGRFFYKLNVLDKSKISGQHLCNQDTYTAQYVFKEDQFTLTYCVNGPSKFYEITTEYIKVFDEDVKALGINIENGEII